MKHLLSIETLARVDLEQILTTAATLKKERGHHAHKPLTGKIWALLFSKSSTRTRVSFEAGIRELGGEVMFLAAAYKQSLGWLLCCLFVPLASFVFLFMHFRKAIRAFGFATAGLLVALVGGWMAGIQL